MKLSEYLKLYKDDVDFDMSDNEIDYTVTICFDHETYYNPPTGEFPYFYKFVNLLLNTLEIDYLLSDGTPVCKITSLILNNKEKFLQFAKEHWEQGYYDAVKDDDTELCYQFIKEFDNTAGGRYDESMNKAYYELLLYSYYFKEMSLKTQ